MRSGRIPLVAVLALVVAAPLVLAAASTVQKVELATSASNSARVTLDFSAVPARKVFTLDKPHRVVVDLQGARLAGGLRLPQPAGPVRTMRTGAQPNGTLRLVIELTGKLDSRARLDGTRLTIDIGDAAKQTVAASGPPIAAPVPAATAPVRAAHAPADTGRDVIVAVDAGHGGEDPGAIGKGGTYEKTVVMAIARLLAQRIDQEPGMRAYLTRNEDRKIPLPERISRARKAGADLFVSIHADAIENRSVSGSSVYVMSEHGASSEAARLLAERENAVDLKGGISLGDKDAQLASVLMGISQSANIADSMQAAQQVLSQLDRVGTIRRTQVQKANFWVLRLPDIPSMLVETAFISNPAEEKKLRDPAHQAALADAILAGVREYFRVSPPDGTLFARQRDSRRTGVAPIIAGGAGP